DIISGFSTQNSEVDEHGGREDNDNTQYPEKQYETFANSPETPRVSELKSNMLNIPQASSPSLQGSDTSSSTPNRQKSTPEFVNSSQASPSDIETCFSEEEITPGLDEEVWHVQKNINTLVSNVNLIALERQDQLNRCQRLKQQLEQLWGDGRILDIHLNMSSKALDVELRQLESLKNDCDHFRTERNKDYHHMLVVQQQVVEHKEKYKLIITEVENLKALSNQRERQLNKLYIKLESENKDRKTLCNQLAAWTRQLKDTKLEKVAASEKVRQVHLGIAKCRHEGSTLQKEYNTLVSERNFQGLKLRDMLEEAVIFQEQIKTFHDMIKRADSELEQRMEASTVELLKKFIKRNKNSAKKLVKVSEELEQVTTKEFELETKFEIGNRHKMIEGLILKLQEELTIMQVVCQGTIQTSSQQKKTEGLCRQAKALVSELALAHTSVKQLKLESALKA
ncbi:unnamed protein product, partial [Timema podura]|nr:unnamed protein product [Timema podura]